MPAILGTLDFTWTDEAACEAAAQALSEDFAPITDFRASADYRLRVARNLFAQWAEAALARTRAGEAP